MRSRRIVERAVALRPFGRLVCGQTCKLKFYEEGLSLKPLANAPGVVRRAHHAYFPYGVAAAAIAVISSTEDQPDDYSPLISALILGLGPFCSCFQLDF